MCRLSSSRRKEVTRMDFLDWTMIDHVANVGTFIIALLTHFKSKK